jgi:Fe-Mn family superoxide dismutase
MPITLPALPYAKNALEPHISAETLEFHHGKHHSKYVATYNELVEGTPNTERTLEDVILTSDGKLFNNAAQVWNHTFYWNCLKPGGGGQPAGPLADAINRDFGSFDKFREAFATAAAAQFGSGWAWLVTDRDRLAITTTANADLPVKHKQIALLTIDVWEHAYYIDFRNARPKYIDAVIDNLVNWEFVADNYTKATR